jgi:hypothetical protein
MKKLLTLALAMALVVVSNAANINWSVSGNTTTYVYLPNDAGTASGSSLYSGTVYLILASDLSSLSGHTKQSDFEDALADLTLATTSASSGVKPDVNKVLVSNDLLTAGSSTTFAMLIYGTDKDGNGYYKAATASATPWPDGTTANNQKTVTTAWAKLANDTQAPYTSAWTKPTDPDPGPTPGVPEPATGALALAGVALLFKRRRA